MSDVARTVKAHDSTPNQNTKLKKDRYPLVMGIVMVTSVASGVILTQLLAGDNQTAANIINGIAALIAVTNVLLTFYLLRTAQRQLEILREDLETQQTRHDHEMREQESRRSREAEESRSDLENMQDLLNGQSEALILARTDAQQAQIETAKSRFDLVAPRVSIRPYTADVSTVQFDDMPDWSTPDGDQALEMSKIDTMAIRVEIVFTINNWGDDPVTYSTSGSMSPIGHFLLTPGREAHFTHTINRTARDWIETLEGKMNVDGSMPDETRAPTSFSFTVPVMSLGAEVVDNHRWAGTIMPIRNDGHGFILNPGESILENGDKVAIRNRDYIPLRSDRIPGDSAKVNP